MSLGFVAGCVLGLATQGSVITPTQLSDWLDAALMPVRQSPAVHIRIAGTDTTAGTAQPVESALLWNAMADANGNYSAKLRALEHRTEGPILYVGDGSTLWIWYDSKRQYSAMTYGPSQPIDAYLSALCQGLASHAKGPLGMMVRMLQDTIMGLAPKFTPFLTNAELRYCPDPFDDPIVPKRWYQPTKDRMYFMTTIGTPARKAVVYEVSRTPELPSWAMSGIWYSEWNPRDADKSRYLEWSAAITVDAAIPDQAFKFVPPAGAKAIIIPSLKRRDG